MRLRLWLGWMLIPGILAFLPSERNVEVIAHRGLSSAAPENTLPAIRMAIELGVDAVEMDLRTTRDGTVVLMHDPLVDRTTDGHGKVQDLSFDQLRSLDAGKWFSEEFRGVRVPTLDEVIYLSGGRVRLYLDIKTRDFRAITSIVKRHNFSSFVYYRAYLPTDITRLRGLDPAGQVVFDLESLTNQPGIVTNVLGRYPDIILSSQLEHWTLESGERVRERGTPFFVNVLGGTSVGDRFDRALAMFPRGILTDSPRSLLKRLGR